MRRSTFAVWATALSLPIAASAAAGYTSSVGVTITEPYAQYDGRMVGSMTGARNAPNNVEYIQCRRGICWMRDASGKTRSCWVQGEDDLAKLDSIGPASYLTVYWDDSFFGATCTDFSVYNGSQYLP